MAMNNSFTDFNCQNLNLNLGGKQLFQNFSFKFKGPGIVMIEGENGTGKSTMLKVFAGFINAPGATIMYSEKKSVEIPIGFFSCFTTTSLGLLNDLTGREHIELISKAMKLDIKFVNTKISEYEEIELFKEILKKPVIDFSQGMKQFLRLFLHLFFGPQVVFLDEPFLYLSPKLKDFVQRKIEVMSCSSLFFITEQKFTWDPKVLIGRIKLGEK